MTQLLVAKDSFEDESREENLDMTQLQLVKNSFDDDQYKKVSDTED